MLAPDIHLILGGVGIHPGQAQIDRRAGVIKRHAANAQKRRAVGKDQFVRARRIGGAGAQHRAGTMEGYAIVGLVKLVDCVRQDLAGVFQRAEA